MEAGYVLALTVPLLLVALACRVDEVGLLHQWPGGYLGFELRVILEAVAPIVLWGLGWVALLRILRGRARQAALCLLHLLTLVAGLTLLVTHAFYRATGTHLDWPELVFGAGHLPMLRATLLADSTRTAQLELLGTPLLGLWPLVVPPLRRLWLSPTPRGGWRLGDLGGLAGAVALALAAGLLRPPGPLGRSELSAIWGGALHALVAPEAPGPARPTRLVPLRVAGSGGQPRRNVLVVMLESMRARSTTPYAPRLPTTPFLATLAHLGVRAARAYTVVPHTTKALVAVHCGIDPQLSPHTPEARSGALPRDCLARILSRRGYATGFFSAETLKFEHNWALVRHFGFQHVVSAGDLAAEARHFERVNEYGYEDKALLAPVLSWIDTQVRAKRPFFAGVLTASGHAPYGLPSTWVRRHYVADPRRNAYLNSLRYTDQFLEALYQGLEARGLTGNTEIVLLGDHGEGLSEHGLNFHNDLPYEEGLRIPLILVGPGIGPPGRVVSGLRENLDVMPTLLHLLGLRVVHGSLPGHDLLRDPGHRRTFTACWPKDHCLTLHRGTRATLYFYDRKAPEAYDLSADPEERDDLVHAGKVRPEALHADVAAMLRWKARVNAGYALRLRRRHGLTLPHPARWGFGDRVRLVGWGLDRRTVRPGKGATLTCAFTVRRRPGPGWRMRTRLVGRQGWVVDEDHVPDDGTQPVARWRPHTTIIDHAWLKVPAGTPPGRYQVRLGMVAPGLGQREVVLGNLEVRAGGRRSGPRTARVAAGRSRSAPRRPRRR